MKGRHLLSIQDLSGKEIIEILDLADSLKKELKAGRPQELLRLKNLGMIFAKPSTRTRVSFEAGMAQLGGQAIYLGVNDLQLGRGETIPDTARTLSRYVDAIMARLFRHKDMVELARNSSVPVINGLTDLHHPCQTLADLETIREHKGRLKGLNVAWVGDGNNVCNSLMQGCSLVGANFIAGCPKGFEPPADVTDEAKRNALASGSRVEIVNDPVRAVEGADVIYTDVWVSMGQEEETKRRLEIFKPYQVNAHLVAKAKADSIVMHCLPAKRGLEITDEVIDGPHSVVFDQAENRMHAQKAALVLLIGTKSP